LATIQTEPDARVILLSYYKSGCDEKQPQVLRLRLAPSHPSDENLSLGPRPRVKLRSG
jgi:hypothetical protein